MLIFKIELFRLKVATEKLKRHLFTFISLELVMCINDPQIQVRNKKRRAPQEKTKKQKKNVKRKESDKPESSKRAKK